ncbi:Uncharacterised protein [Mycobacteroides abscessus subsp. abscessus]|nr:Uncharacterised protein [Mycobacteroides abscessus subsp. abscessus]
MPVCSNGDSADDASHVLAVLLLTGIQASLQCQCSKRVLKYCTWVSNINPPVFSYLFTADIAPVGDQCGRGRGVADRHMCPSIHGSLPTFARTVPEPSETMLTCL